jgi:hypothetical protein
MCALAVFAVHNIPPSARAAKVAVATLRFCTVNLLFTPLAETRF